MGSSPWSGWTQKRLRRPDHLPGTARAAAAARRLGRRVPGVPAQTPTLHGVATPVSCTDLTEYRYQGVPKCLRCSAGVPVPIDDRDRVESLSPLPRRFTVAMA